MEIVNEEEKKEGAEHADAAEKDCTSANIDEEDNDSIESDETDEELGDLPSEIAEEIGKDRCFETEQELEDALDKAGVGDLPVVLVGGKLRLIMPSVQHNEFTTYYANDFTLNWAKDRWGLSSPTHKIHLSNGRSRDPDLSFWGFPRCIRDEEKNLSLAVKGSVADVIIQFCWKNTQAYEENAIDDMMNLSLEKNRGDVSHARPSLGYLIKVQFSKKRKLPGGDKIQDMAGLDIYRLPHGTTIANACDPNNLNAQHWYYKPDGPEIYITITPQDLGITGLWAWICGEYKIKASAIFKNMN